MYRCDVCQQVVPPGIRARRRVVETVTHTHPVRPKALTAPPDPQRRRSQRARRHLVTDIGGVGSQIVREVNACPRCAAPPDTGPDATGPDAP